MGVFSEESKQILFLISAFIQRNESTITKILNADTINIDAKKKKNKTVRLHFNVKHFRLNWKSEKRFFYLATVVRETDRKFVIYQLPVSREPWETEQKKRAYRSLYCFRSSLKYYRVCVRRV